jgi:hypothetical protein
LRARISEREVRRRRRRRKEKDACLTLKHKRIDHQNQHAEVKVAEIKQEEKGRKHNQRPKRTNFPVTLRFAGGDCDQERTDFLF